MHHFVSFILRIAYAAAFGYILTFHAEDIVFYIPQLLGGLLMLETVGQLVELFLLKMKTNVRGYFFIVPLFVLVYALFLIFHSKLVIAPDTSIREIFDPAVGISKLTIEMSLVGFCLIAFVLSEVVISIAFFKPLYQPKKFAEEKAKQLEAQRALDAERARQAAEAEKAAKMAEKAPESPESQPFNV